MVAQFTQQQQLAPPQTASPSLSPAQWNQLAQLAQAQQLASPQQAAPPSTSAYTSTGTMSAIDPAQLQAQWLQYQQGQLAQSAIIPQYTSQYAPAQPQGEFLSSEVIDAIADFIRASNLAAIASAQYIAHLRSELNQMDSEYCKLRDFSGTQDMLIGKFLFDPVFTLNYIRDTWTQAPINNEFMSRFADFYLEIDALSPNGRSREFSGNPNTSFSAAIVPQQPQYQNTIPPLPSSGGNTTPYITMDQYLAAQQQGEIAQARAAAMQNPAGLYAAFLSQQL